MFSQIKTCLTLFFIINYFFCHSQCSPTFEELEMMTNHSRSWCDSTLKSKRFIMGHDRTKEKKDISYFCGSDTDRLNNTQISLLPSYDSKSIVTFSTPEKKYAKNLKKHILLKGFQYAYTKTILVDQFPTSHIYFRKGKQMIMFTSYIVNGLKIYYQTLGIEN